MADITKEIESLRDFVFDSEQFSRIWMQALPAKYTAGELSIRFIGDTSASETGYHYRIDRDYQFVYFGATEVECIRRASALQRKLKNTDIVKLKDSTRFLRLGSFSFSQPFKTEGNEVYAIIGVLQVQVRQAREFESVNKMQEINTEII